MFLRNIPIGKRILFGLLPLIIALLLQSVVLIHQQVLDTERGHILSGLVDVAIQTNAVIHELQRERGASALFVGSKGSQFARQMGEQRMATDQRIVSLEGVVGSLEAAMVDAFGSSAVQAVRMAVKRLPDLRKQIDSLEGRPIEIVSAYSEMIRILLGSVVRIGIVSPDVQTAQLISSYVALTDAKEAAGQERATFGGIEVLRYMTMAEIFCPTAAVVTGYEGFLREDGMTVDLAQLRVEWMEEFPGLLRAVLHYNSTVDEWKIVLARTLLEAGIGRGSPGARNTRRRRSSAEKVN